jgi:hypothetical protein
MANCKLCDAPMEQAMTGRRGSYCSDACRQAALRRRRIEDVPTDMVPATREELTLLLAELSRRGAKPGQVSAIRTLLEEMRRANGEGDEGKPVSVIDELARRRSKTG